MQTQDRFSGEGGATSKKYPWSQDRQMAGRDTVRNFSLVAVVTASMVSSFPLKEPAWSDGNISPPKAFEIAWVNPGPALFALAIGSELRGCDLVKIKIGDILCDRKVRTRAIVVQQKAGRPVQFELMDDARASMLRWLELRGGSLEIMPSRAARIIRPTSVAHGSGGAFGHFTLPSSAAFNTRSTLPDQIFWISASE